MKRLIVVCATFLSLALNSAEPSHVVVAFVSPLADQYRQELGTGIGNLLFQSEPGTRITLVDAAQLETVVDVTVPPGNIRLRQQKLAPEIIRAVRTLRAATNAAAPFNAPRLLDHIGMQIRTSGRPLNLLIIGPSRYRNPKEPAFDMSATWPSDGHLSAGVDRSVFSTVERDHRLDQVTVEWLVTDMKEYANQSHAEGVSRFWNLYIATQGGRLGGFSPDFRNALLGASGARRTNRPVPELDPTDREVVMHSRIVHRTPAATSTTNAVLDIPSPPPGKTGLAIIWEPGPGAGGRVDLDLHVQPPGGGPEIYFGRPISPFGRLFRDVLQSLPAANGPWRSSWEYVELEGDALPNEVWINLYSGRGPVQGILRTHDKGRELNIRFEFPEVLGDWAQRGRERETSSQWKRVNLQPMTK